MRSFLKNSQGNLPVKIKFNTQPNEYTSVEKFTFDLTLSSSKNSGFKTSGEEYLWVNPPFIVQEFLVFSLYFYILDPKSETKI